MTTLLTTVIVSTEPLYSRILNVKDLLGLSKAPCNISQTPTFTYSISDLDTLSEGMSSVVSYVAVVGSRLFYFVSMRVITGLVLLEPHSGLATGPQYSKTSRTYPNTLLPNHILFLTIQSLVIFLLLVARMISFRLTPLFYRQISKNFSTWRKEI